MLELDSTKEIPDGDTCMTIANGLGVNYTQRARMAKECGAKNPSSLSWRQRQTRRSHGS